MIKAVFDSILVEPLELNKTKYGSLIIPDTGKEKGLYGKIVSIGPGKYSVTGDFMPTSLCVGDLVMLPNMGPVKVEHDGKEYYGCAETMVMAVIEENK